MLPAPAPRTGPGHLYTFFLADAAVLFAFYLWAVEHMPRRPPLAERAAFWVYCLSFLLTLALLLATGLAALARGMSRRGLDLFCGALGTCLCALLWLDTRTYLLLGVHLYSPTVSKALENAELNREIHLDRASVVGAALVIALMAAGQALLLRAGRRWPLRPAHPAFLALLALLGAGWSTTALLRARLFGPASPVATLLPLRDVLRSGFRKSAALRVDYPRSADVAVRRRPKIVVLAIESLRADVFGPELMPNLHRFAAQPGCLRPARHYSGSHVTEYGVFSLLYGLDAYHFLPFSQAQVPSYPLNVLRRSGYRLAGASASALQHWNQSAFLTSPFAPYQEFRARRAHEDDADLLAWARQVRAGFGPDPYFLFLFLNSTHINYSYPPPFEKHRPVLGEDWIHRMSAEKFPRFRQEIVNRYKNSVLYVDHLFGQLIDELRAEWERGDLVVVVTGDHGEEFWEHGLFGHVAPEFDNERTQVPLVLCLPGAAPPAVDLSGHADIMATVLDYLGAPPQALGYLDGVSLLRPVPADRYQVISAAGFPLEARELCLLAGQRKYWLAQDADFLDHYSPVKITDLGDRLLGGPEQADARLAGLVTDFNRRFARFLHP